MAPRRSVDPGGGRPGARNRSIARTRPTPEAWGVGPALIMPGHRQARKPTDNAPTAKPKAKGVVEAATRGRALDPIGDDCGRPRGRARRGDQVNAGSAACFERRHRLPDRDLLQPSSATVQTTSGKLGARTRRGGWEAASARPIRHAKPVGFDPRRGPRPRVSRGRRALRVCVRVCEPVWRAD